MRVPLIEKVYILDSLSLSLLIRVYILIYIYRVNPRMNYRPSSNQLFRQVRILYLSMTAKPNPHFKRPCQATVQVRREHAVNDNTVLFQPKTNSPMGNPKIQSLLLGFS